jgi:3-oxoacyl-[acyl-carrier protein] reductase
VEAKSILNTTSKRVLVTGASKGIGAACALLLAQQGFSVTVHYHRGKTEAEALVTRIQETGAHADSLQFDVSDRAQTKRVLENDIEANGAWYGVVCNAGIARDNAFPAMTELDWDSVLNTNLNAFYNVLHPLVMPMIRLRQGGRIVVMTSVSGLVGNRGQVNYSAAKSGLIGAAKALATELAKRHITVNCVAPGIIKTAMIDELPEADMLKAVPMQRLGTPEDVAGAVAFLCSDAASYVTRQVLSVNGGLF